MSGDEKPQADQSPAGPPQRQPIFNLPLSVLILGGILLAIQAAAH